MKRHTMLITTTTLALFTWPLRAQDNPPDRPQNPPQNIEGPRNSDARSRDREPEPRDAQFQRGDNPMRRPDGTGGRGPRTAHPQDFRRDRPNDPQDISRDDARPNAGQTDPPRDPDAKPQMGNYGSRDGQFRRGGARMQRREGGDDRGPRAARPQGQFQDPRPASEGPQGPPQQAGQQDDRRDDEQGPRYRPQGPAPVAGWRPPQMVQRFDGMRPHQRRMIGNDGFAPRRGPAQDFSRGENEMRAPMPPQQQVPGGPQFGRRAPNPGLASGWDRNEQAPRMDGPGRMMNQRPQFGPPDRGNHGPRFAPREGFNGLRPPMDQAPRPRRDGPPQGPRDDGRRPGFE